MEELGTGKLMKYGGGLLVLIGAALAAVGTSSMGAYIFFAALALIGAGLFKVGEHLEKRQAAEASKTQTQVKR